MTRMQIACVDIARDGLLFASGGLDRQVKLWYYDEGECIAVGTAHSGGVNKVKIAPDNSIIISAGEEGAICIWQMPGAEESTSAAPSFASSGLLTGTRVDKAAVTSKVPSNALRTGGATVSGAASRR